MIEILNNEPVESVEIFRVNLTSDSEFVVFNNSVNTATVEIFDDDSTSTKCVRVTILSYSIRIHATNVHDLNVCGVYAVGILSLVGLPFSVLESTGTAEVCAVIDAELEKDVVASITTSPTDPLSAMGIYLAYNPPLKAVLCAYLLLLPKGLVMKILVSSGIICPLQIQKIMVVVYSL